MKIRLIMLLVWLCRRNIDNWFIWWLKTPDARSERALCFYPRGFEKKMTPYSNGRGIVLLRWHHGDYPNLEQWLWKHRLYECF